MYIMYMYNMIYHFYHQISLIKFVNTLATVKNRSRKPMTITICNQILDLKKVLLMKMKSMTQPIVIPEQFHG